MRELSMSELEQVSGGEFDIASIGVGLGAIALGATFLFGAGLAGIPIAIIGAITIGEGITIGAAFTAAAAGGALIGSGVSEGLEDGDS